VQVNQVGGVVFLLFFLSKEGPKQPCARRAYGTQQQTAVLSRAKLWTQHWTLFVGFVCAVLRSLARLARFPTCRRCVRARWA
jgi:hypothetical protein